MSIFNNQDLYPTPDHVTELMLQGVNLKGKTILEPSAGFGNIVDFCIGAGAANVIACEQSPELVKILATKCKVIGNDFMQVKSHDISHVDLIIMNPPFSADEKHINHAFEIAPEGCKIIALCNYNTLSNTYSSTRRILKSNIEIYGRSQNLGKCFSDAERQTDVEIGLVILDKPLSAGANYDNEFEGFFTDEDPEETQYNGLMPYNFIRDVVNRYVAAVKIYDQQLDAAVQMNNLTSNFYKSKLAMSCTEEGKPKSRSDFKKDLQKSAWTFIFGKMKMEKYTTQGLKDDLNKFVEQQNEVPFTMGNIYKMLEIIIGTQGQRMDKALLEVFDKLTMHHHDNRFNVEGWKTNSYYLVNKKFILEYVSDSGWGSGEGVQFRYDSRNVTLLEDLHKALCYLTGEHYTNINLYQFFQGKTKADWGQWFDWGFFEMKAYRKGTVHCKFKDIDTWGRFNQTIAKLKNYPLFEHKKAA